MNEIMKYGNINMDIVYWIQVYNEYMGMFHLPNATELLTYVLVYFVFTSGVMK